MNNLNVIKYSGHFAFIKPFTAVRDSLTHSQQFLTPSMIEGIRQHLEVKSILRHKLSAIGITRQQECIQAITKKIKREKGVYKANTGIITLGLLIEPWLYLAFDNTDCAEIAFQKHVCLSRNEYVLLPDEEYGIKNMTTDEFDSIQGTELLFKSSPTSLIVGYNRFDNYRPMYGQISIRNGFIRE